MEIIKSWPEVLIKLTDNLGKAIQVLHDGGLRIALIVEGQQIAWHDNGRRYSTCNNERSNNEW